VAVLAAGTLTRELIEASGECVIQAPVRAQADLTLTVGEVSGRDVDKLARYEIATAPASRVGAPLIEGCAAWLECKVIDEPGIKERYDLFVLECVAAWADDELYVGGEWRFSDDARRTIHHLSRGLFFMTGERVEAKKR
jgi:flavin reductase (DIM6/NTAB) family NADH-FMN oxidoreductase RutF